MQGLNQPCIFVSALSETPRIRNSAVDEGKAGRGQGRTMAMFKTIF
jgi:hypothetical protein